VLTACCGAGILVFDQLAASLFGTELGAKVFGLDVFDACAQVFTSGLCIGGAQTSPRLFQTKTLFAFEAFATGNETLNQIDFFFRTLSTKAAPR
jgi:hypothetical protein